MCGEQYVNGEGNKKMAYHRYDFTQYFIDNSEDYNKTGRSTRQIHYEAVSYHCNGLEKLLKRNHEMNYEIYYDKIRNVIQINFQKTNGISDWFVNIFEFSDKYYDAIEFNGYKLQLKVHHGWGEMYKSVKKTIRAEWKKLIDENPDAETEIVGWSLGSGQAILCCQDLNYNFGVKPHLITFGSVRPFASSKKDCRMLKKYLSTVSKECYNFANINDIVTYMPPFRRFSMINRVEIGQSESRTIGRLLRPTVYHTTYDCEELYRGIKGNAS